MRTAHSFHCSHWPEVWAGLHLQQSSWEGTGMDGTPPWEAAWRQAVLSSSCPDTTACATRELPHVNRAPQPFTYSAVFTDFTPCSLPSTANQLLHCCTWQGHMVLS